MRQMMETTALEPPLGDGRHSDLRLGNSAQNFVAVSTSVECRDLASPQGAYRGGVARPVAIEKNSLPQIVAGELLFLQALHVRADELSECTPFCNPTRFTPEAFILIRKARKESFHEAHFPMRQVKLWIQRIELHPMTALAVPLVADWAMICSRCVLFVTTIALKD